MILRSSLLHWCRGFRLVALSDHHTAQLLVVVQKGELVPTLFQHGSLAYPTTLRSVGFQQILPCVAVQAALAEVLALLMLALVTEKTVEVFDPGVVKFSGLLDQQKIDSGHFLRLGSEPVNSQGLIPTKNVNC